MLHCIFFTFLVDHETYLHQEEDPRYRGAAIPSRAFRFLQNMTDSTDASVTCLGKTDYIKNIFVSCHILDSSFFNKNNFIIIYSFFFVKSATCDTDKREVK